MRAFSLVELSIVLVILGLLVGGILAGQSLIRASELRSVAAEYQRYISATMAFRDKYFAIPGDFNNAQAFWGIATCPGTSATPSIGTATCNGDGDGTVQRITSSSNEIYRFWQHLANAGLIEGRFTGVANDVTASSAASLVGTNVPASKLAAAGYTAYWYNTVPIIDVNNFEGPYGTFFFFGSTNGTNVSADPVLRPAEAWNIDTKLDDSMPALGRVMAREYQGGTCTDLAPSTTNSMMASIYLLSNDNIACGLVLKTGL